MNLANYQASSVHRVLIFGPPKSGKSAVAGQLAKHYKLIWFDCEDGVKTLLNPELGLTKEDLSRVTLVSLPDTKDYPIAAETLHKVVNWKPLTICDLHGKIDCLKCKQGGTFTQLNPDEWDNNTILVFDSMTQLSNSVMAMIMKSAGRVGYEAKAEWDDYGKQGSWLDRWLSILQNCPYNVIVISHEMGIEQEDGKEKLTAVGGTRNFSRNLPRYFDHVCYAEIKLKKHILGSSTSYGVNVVTGSRTGAKTEVSKEQNPLLEIFTSHNQQPTNNQ